jgi:superfamily II RNA helicase
VLGAALDAAPGRLATDDILGALLEYVTQLGLSLYPQQEEAIFEILADKHVVLSTPTGSGKSLVAVALMFKAAAEGRRAVWTCPVKALVNEKFFDLCAAFGPERVGLLTGDASVNRSAPILCCTAEILAIPRPSSDTSRPTRAARSPGCAA